MTSDKSDAASTPPRLGTFFIVVPPGLEDLALWELQLVLDALGTSVQSFGPHVGGWEVELPLGTGFALNHWLKIPTRILLRVSSFKAKDFPKVYEKVRKLPWSDFLRQGPIDVVVSTHRSKLKMKERMAKTVQDAIKDCNEHQPLRKSFLQTPQTIYFRAEEDTCSISLDTTGEALFKRGIKKLSVEAPLRETLASALARLVQRSELINGPVEVIDPVCGSGTLLYAFDELPFPIRGRPMAYENFPCTAQVASKSKLKKTPVPWVVQSLLGSDISEKALSATKKNLETWKLAGGTSFDVRKKDLIEVTTPKEPRKGHRRVVLMNPPYGQRISGHSVSVLLTRALEIFEPDVVGLVSPIGEAPKKLPEPYRWFQKPLAVSNGGIDVELRLARRSGHVV